MRPRLIRVHSSFDTAIFSFEPTPSFSSLTEADPKRMSLKDEIEAANQKFMDFFDKGDPKGLSTLYTEDCKLMPSGTETQIGRDAVAKVFGSVMTDMGVKKAVLSIDEVGPLTPGPDMAFERSRYEFFDDKGGVVDKGKYVVIWKKVNGDWFLYIDIFNTNTPPSQK